VNERGEARDVTVGAPATGTPRRCLDDWIGGDAVGVVSGPPLVCLSMLGRERGKAAAALRSVGAAARLPCAGLEDTMIG
jgi:hypothetical protein